MRKRVQVTYWKYETKKGYRGHWHMHYYVKNVIDLESQEVILDSYVFEESTLFKGKGFKEGDKAEVTVTIEQKDNGLKLLRPYNLIKIK